MEEIGATDIQRPHREEKRSVPGEPPSRHSVEAPWSFSNEPTVPASSSYNGAHPVMDPDPRPKGTPSPSIDPTEPGGPGPTKQPPGVSLHITDLPALDTENQ
ncbi:hypothetical protein AMECASPLE_025931 [Ameca splendens]|uniref:Uncharacterized protein n=1 Tax=Ameca splendens TaxID=208324 RepID=A0ABV0ZR12_9TELE